MRANVCAKSTRHGFCRRSTTLAWLVLIGDLDAEAEAEADMDAVAADISVHSRRIGEVEVYVAAARGRVDVESGPVQLASMEGLSSAAAASWWGSLPASKPAPSVCRPGPWTIGCRQGTRIPLPLKTVSPPIVPCCNRVSQERSS